MPSSGENPDEPLFERNSSLWQSLCSWQRPLKVALWNKVVTHTTNIFSLVDWRDPCFQQFTLCILCPQTSCWRKRYCQSLQDGERRPGWLWDDASSACWACFRRLLRLLLLLGLCGACPVEAARAAPDLGNGLLQEPVVLHGLLRHRNVVGVMPVRPCKMSLIEFGYGNRWNNTCEGCKSGCLQSVPAWLVYYRFPVPFPAKTEQQKIAFLRGWTSEICICT